MRIQLRNGSDAAWTADDPVLAVGEPGYETDTGRMKIGDGSTTWASLGFYGIARPGLILPVDYGLVAASAVIETAQTSSSFGSGSLFIAKHVVPANNSISKAWCVNTVVGTFASNGFPNGFVLYDHTGAQIAATANDQTVFGTAGWQRLSFTSPVAASAADTTVYLAVMINGWTGNSLAYASLASTATPNGPTGRRVGFQSGSTAFPASITPASYLNLTSFIPLLGLS